MRQITQHQATTDLARTVIEQLAPHDLPLFAPTSQAFFRDPDAAARHLAAKDEILGTGVLEIAATDFLVPLVLTVAQKIVEYAMEPAKQPIQQRLGATITRLLIKLGLAKKADVVVTVSPLSPSQLVAARRLAIQTLEQYQLPKEQTELVADALMGKLALMANAPHPSATRPGS